MTQSRPPVVGITTKRLTAAQISYFSEPFHNLGFDGVLSDYSQSVGDAGGVPLLIPSAAPVDAVLELVHGLVLSGGEDVTPSLYGSERGPNATENDLARDQFELDLIVKAIDKGIPILAICRGIQILNVACGGTLVPDLPEVDGFCHATASVEPHVRRHQVVIDPGSNLGRVLSADADSEGSLTVNSYHHQAIDSPGENLRIVARAFDGTVEGVERTEPPIIGVQWHPELYPGTDPVFTWLVTQATQYATTRERELIREDQP